MRNPERLLDILACPVCRARPLALSPRHLKCEGCNRVYRIVNGVPVLDPEQRAVRIMPLDHHSNPVADEHIRWLSSFRGYTLNLGAGASEFSLANCVELEYSIFRTTDVVGDAHCLPFRDAVFHAVISMNTFEHLRDPAHAARELYRVLRPGGRILLHTAFMQPLHEEPHHYYNTTEYGLRRWFSDFEIESCSVPRNMFPPYWLGWLSTELLHHVGITLGAEQQERLAATTLEDWRRYWGDPETRDNPVWKIFDELPQDVLKRFSGGFELRAAKPNEARTAGQ